MTPGPDEIGPPADPSPAASPVTEPSSVHREPPPICREPPIVDYEPPPPAPQAKEVWRAGVTVLVATWQAFLALFLGLITVGLVGMTIESMWHGRWDGCTLATGTLYPAITGFAAVNIAKAAIGNFRADRTAVRSFPDKPNRRPTDGPIRR